MSLRTTQVSAKRKTDKAMTPSLLSRLTSRFLHVATAALVPTLSLFAQEVPLEPDAEGSTVLTIGRQSLAVSRFSAPTLSGEVGAKKMMGAPKIGEATAVFQVTDGNEIAAWLSSAWEGGSATADTSVKILDQDNNVIRGLDMGACTLTLIEWPTLGAFSKDAFEVTAKWSPQNIKYVGGGGKAQGVMGQKARLTTSSFTVTMPGIPDHAITSIGLPKITPKIAKESHGKFRTAAPTYEAPGYSSIKVEIGAAGYKTAEDLAVRILQDGNCEESEFIDIVIDMKDQSLRQTLATFTLRAGLQSFNWAPNVESGKESFATAVLEFGVSDFRFTSGRR
jgi:hypothetical protein